MVWNFTYSRLIALIGGCILLAGCSDKAPVKNFNGVRNQIPANIASPLAQAPEPSMPAAPAAPYVLSAESNGREVNFSVYNLSADKLNVKREDFAMLALAENNSPLQFRKSNDNQVIVDIADNATVNPNSTITGKIILTDHQNPVGDRLIFKPDNIGTFADIQPARKSAQIAAADKGLEPL